LVTGASTFLFLITQIDRVNLLIVRHAQIDDATHAGACCDATHATTVCVLLHCRSFFAFAHRAFAAADAMRARFFGGIFSIRAAADFFPSREK
jgi:hypothetical protein